MRIALAKPLYASIFLVVNGLILFGGEHFRRRSEVRELAAPRGRQAPTAGGGSTRSRSARQP